MGKAKTAATRTFQGTRKGVSFEVVSPLTDREVIAALETIPGTFAADCAAEVEKAGIPGMRVKGNLIAWAHRLAGEKLNPTPKAGAATFDTKAIGKFCRARKPLRFEVDGQPFEMGFCGPNSKNPGFYRLTNGMPFGSPSQAFYGYVKVDGSWTPTRAVTPAIAEAITTFLRSLGA